MPFIRTPSARFRIRRLIEGGVFLIAVGCMIGLPAWLSYLREQRLLNTPAPIVVVAPEERSASQPIKLRPNKVKGAIPATQTSGSR